jgi:orotidine 5'-phosphate decarboxylase subfamily 1
MTDNSRLIVALDIGSPDKAMELAREVYREIFAIKINWPLLMVAGVGIISELSSYGKVICDLKIADIPNTNSLITSNVRENGGWGIITHTFTGSDSLGAVIDAAGDMKVFAVVSMSHPGSDQFINPVSMDLLRMAVKQKNRGSYCTWQRSRNVEENKGRGQRSDDRLPGYRCPGRKSGGCHKERIRLCNCREIHIQFGRPTW